MINDTSWETMAYWEFYSHAPWWDVTILPTTTSKHELTYKMENIHISITRKDVTEISSPQIWQWLSFMISNFSSIMKPSSAEREYFTTTVKSLIESTKTMSMEDVSTGVLEKIKNIQEVKTKPKIDMMYQDIYNCICQNTNNMKIYYPVCQTYSPTGV